MSIPPSADSDGEFRDLVARAQKGCEVSMRQIIEELEPRVLGLVRLHQPHGEDPADVAQEVFIKIFRKLHQYKHAVPFWNWVSKITVNTCIDLIRANRRHPAVRWADLNENEQRALENRPSSDACQPTDIDAAEVIEKLLAALGPQERMLIRELELAQKTPAEVAKMTGWTAGNVRIKAFRARRKLQMLYRKLEKSSPRTLT